MSSGQINPMPFSGPGNDPSNDPGNDPDTDKPAIQVPGSDSPLIETGEPDSGQQPDEDPNEQLPRD